MPSYLIDQILPTQRVSLVGGISNTGKSRWILPNFINWSRGMPILGLRSFPCKWAYVSGDRLLVEVADTISTMGLNPENIPVIPAFGPHNKTWVQVVTEAGRLGVEFLIWEGFGDLVPHPQHKSQVREFLSHISAVCCTPCKEFPNGLTVLGVVESPKLKPHERYKSARERISGVASWGYHTSTIFLIEPEDPEDLGNPRRVMHCSLKNAPSFYTLGDFDHKGFLFFDSPLMHAENAAVREFYAPLIVTK